MRKLMIIAALLFSSLACAQTAKQAPQLDSTRTQALVIVADLVAGVYFAPPPPPADCSKPNIVCIDMNPPPFSLIASVQMTVYGEPVKDKIELFTHSHYGILKYEKGVTTRLVRLNTDGQYFFMPKYAEQELFQSKAKELYLLIMDGEPIWWLPCSAFDLKEEVYSAHFETSLEFPATTIPSRRIKNFPDFFHVTANGAIPRYAISISKLSAHLKQIKPNSSEMSCEGKRQ